MDHKRKHKQRKVIQFKKEVEKTTSIDEQYSDLWDLQEKAIEDSPYERKCRVCLNEGNVMINGDESVGDLREAIKIHGGIDIQEDDHFPKYLCHDCHKQLLSAIKFRQNAQATDQFMKGCFLPNENPIILDLEEFTEKDMFKETLADLNTIYHCRSCKIDLLTSTEYGRHMLTADHKDLKDKCPFCCREYSNIRRHLELHMRTKTMKCNICGKKYLKNNYIQHQESHCDILPYKCSECPYRGRHASDFKVHMRKHTGERPYQCPDCSSSFISKSNLNRHLLTHKKDYNFQCTECHKGFNNQCDLDIHTKVNHIGLKDELCSICGKAFGHRKTLMKHLRKVHKTAKSRGGKTPIFLKLQMKNNLDMSHDEDDA